MGISMAICELDCKDSLCKKGKETVIKARLPSVAEYEQYSDYDEFVDMSEAKKAFSSDFEQFLKKNRLDGGKESFLLSKLKNADDAEKLRPYSKKSYTGWVNLDKLSADVQAKLIAEAGPDNLMTEWDTIPLTETNDICAKCPMSWDKGRGCIGAFGPDSSLLPSIAEKNGCKLVANIMKYAESGEKLSPEDAKALSAECKILREKLVDEGKAMVRRYSGVIDRLETMADLCSSTGTRFYFI